MNSRKNIESILEGTPAPGVKAGPHRENLKTELMTHFLERQRQMSNEKARKLTGLLRPAAMIVGAVMLVSSGWASEQIYRRMAKRDLYYSESAVDMGKWDVTTPDGNKITFSSSMSGSISYDNSDTGLQEAKRKRREMKQLIAEKKYEFVEEIEAIETEYAHDRVEYVYKFVLSDGEELVRSFSFPLEDIPSWDAYQDKLVERQAEWRELIKEAIAAGRYRVVDAKVIKSHICQDEGSQNLINVMEIRPDPRVVKMEGPPRAYVHPYPLTLDEGEGYSMSWEDHLQEIAAGRRKLIRMEVLNRYTYELTFQDGAVFRTTFGADKDGKPIIPAVD